MNGYLSNDQAVLLTALVNEGGRKHIILLFKDLNLISNRVTDREKMIMVANALASMRLIEEFNDNDLQMVTLSITELGKERLKEHNECIRIHSSGVGVAPEHSRGFTPSVFDKNQPNEIARPVSDQPVRRMMSTKAQEENLVTRFPGGTILPATPAKRSGFIKAIAITSGLLTGLAFVCVTVVWKYRHFVRSTKDLPLAFDDRLNLFTETASGSGLFYSACLIIPGAIIGIIVGASINALFKRQQCWSESQIGNR
jgi:hypothetical protein